MTREHDLSKFLEHHKLGDFPVIFLAGDASFRKYYRVHSPLRPLVIMDAPPPEAPDKFVQIAHLLYDSGFSVPKIEGADLNNGYVLIEDLGDQTYTKILNSDPSYQKAQELYFLAIDTLIDIHKKIIIKPDFLSTYSPQIHLREAQILIDWYYRAVYHKSLPASAVDDFNALWLSKLEQLDKERGTPHTIVLRDYHVDNLMVLDGRLGTAKCGLLDFQDALWGSATYDIVSLLEDARRDVPQSLREACWKRYFEAFPTLNVHKVLEEATLLSAARHAKIIGIFTRLSIRDGKSGYLCHIPRVWKLLENCLLHPTMIDLKCWFDAHLPERTTPCLNLS